MDKDKLIVEFERAFNVVAMKVINTPEWFRSTEKRNNFGRQGMIEISSNSYPYLEDNIIFVQGKNRANDTEVETYCFGTEQRAREYIEDAKNAIADFNKNAKAQFVKPEKDPELMIALLSSFGDWYKRSLGIRTLGGAGLCRYWEEKKGSKLSCSFCFLSVGNVTCSNADSDYRHNRGYSGNHEAPENKETAGKMAQKILDEIVRLTKGD